MAFERPENEPEATTALDFDAVVAGAPLSLERGDTDRTGQTDESGVGVSERKMQ